LTDSLRADKKSDGETTAPSLSSCIP